MLAPTEQLTALLHRQQQLMVNVCSFLGIAKEALIMMATQSTHLGLWGGGSSRRRETSRGLLSREEILGIASFR